MLSFDKVYPIVVGEALGLYHVIQWMQDMQFNNIDFELDSKITRDDFHSCMTYITEFGNIIDECREQFFSSFTNFRVEFIRRQANTVAHALAREVIFLASPTIYYAIPQCIESRVNYISLPSKMLELHSPLPLMIKYTLPSSLIQNILENMSLPSPKRRLNYILLPSHVKIYILLPQFFF